MSKSILSTVFLFHQIRFDLQSNQVYIMKIVLPILTVLFLVGCQTPSKKVDVLTEDVDRFWRAYDLIQETDSTEEQLAILHKHFIDSASVGQQQLFIARSYTPEEYIENIGKYPKFYASLRKQLKELPSIQAGILQGLQEFEKVYPKVSNSAVVFGMGNFRTNSTTLDSMVLIGTEMLCTNGNIDVSEFGDDMQFVKNYMASEPMNNALFLGVHEFVHTQQIEAYENNLLAIALREGTAEYVATLASGLASVEPCMEYGKEHRDEVIHQFVKEMFNNSHSYWVWSNMPNQFGVRDLGYFVGFEMAKHHIEQSANKDLAIAELIELDYSDSASVSDFVERIGFFEKTMTSYQERYRNAQPQVTSISWSKDTLTIQADQALDTLYRGFSYGPLGEEHVLFISNWLGFVAGDSAFRMVIDTTFSKPQQLIVNSTFRNRNGVELVSKLIER